MYDLDALIDRLLDEALDPSKRTARDTPETYAKFHAQATGVAKKMVQASGKSKMWRMVNHMTHARPHDILP